MLYEVLIKFPNLFVYKQFMESLENIPVEYHINYSNTTFLQIDIRYHLGYGLLCEYIKEFPTVTAKRKLCFKGTRKYVVIQ